MLLVSPYIREDEPSQSMRQHPSPWPALLTSLLPGVSPVLTPKTASGQGSEIAVIGLDRSDDLETKVNASAASSRALPLKRREDGD